MIQQQKARQVILKRRVAKLKKNMNSLIAFVDFMKTKMQLINQNLKFLVQQKLKY